MNVCYPLLSFHSHVHGISFFSIPSLFSLCVFLDLKWVSCRQEICWSWVYLFSHSISFSWSIGPFTFKVNIDRYVLIAILLIVFRLFYSSFGFFFLPLCCLTLWFSDYCYIWIPFSFCLCIYLINFFGFLVTKTSNTCMWLFYVVYFKCILIILHFYFHLMFNVFNIIYIFYFVHPLSTYCGYR